MSSYLKDAFARHWSLSPSEAENALKEIDRLEAELAKCKLKWQKVKGTLFVEGWYFTKMNGCDLVDDVVYFHADEEPDYFDADYMAGPIPEPEGE